MAGSRGGPASADGDGQSRLNLPAYDQNMEGRRTVVTTTPASPTFAGLVRVRSGLRRGCWCACRCGRRRRPFQRDQNNLIVLAVEGAGLCPRLGLYCLFHFETCRAVFLDDSQRAVALRTEGFSGGGIESAAVGSVADRQCGDDLSVIGIEDHTGGGLVAHSEENMIFRVQTQPARPAALSAEVVLGNDFERVDIDHRDLVLVLQINIQTALAVAGGLLRRTTQVNRADD